MMRTRKIDEKLLEAVEENPFVPETVERLVGEGANVGVKNIFGWRPFETVARNAYRDRTYVESYAFLARFHTEKDLMRSIPLFSKEEIGAGAMIALLSGRVMEEKNRKALLDVFNSHRSRGVIVSLGVSSSGTFLDAEGTTRNSTNGREGVSTRRRSTYRFSRNIGKDSERCSGDAARKWGDDRGRGV